MQMKLNIKTIYIDECIVNWHKCHQHQTHLHSCVRKSWKENCKTTIFYFMTCSQGLEWRPGWQSHIKAAVNTPMCMTWWSLILSLYLSSSNCILLSVTNGHVLSRWFFFLLLPPGEEECLLNLHTILTSFS